MTRNRALRLLRDYWGSGEIVTLGIVDEIEKVEFPGESLLETVSRIAQIDLSDVKAFDAPAVWAKAHRALCELDVIEAKTGRQD